MKSSYKILSVFGIDIELHVFFILFLAFLFFSDLMLGILFSMVFVFVTCHEICHSFVAKRNGIKVRKIVLLPIGGMAMMDISNISPATEIKMAIAGPLFNFSVAGLILLGMSLAGIPFTAISVLWTVQAFTLEIVVYYALYVNLLLGLFNLFVPAFPLDGGRIFRALLAMKMDYLQATRIARNVSIIVALSIISLVFIPNNYFYGDYWIMIIAMFIIFAAISEYQGIITHALVSKMTIRNLISKNYLLLKPDEKVKDALLKMSKARKSAALISVGNAVFDVNSIIVPPLPDDKVSKYAVSAGKVELASGSEALFSAFAGSNIPLVPVYSGKKFIGVVYREDIQLAAKLLGMMKK
ncbi:MAG: M50 family metallopeptidase [Candidatus Micrarchaeota archaeon]